MKASLGLALRLLTALVCLPLAPALPALAGPARLPAPIPPAQADPPPVTTLSYTGGTPGLDDWLVTPVLITLTAADPLGEELAGIAYRLDAGSWVTYTVPFGLPEGPTSLSYRATDVSGGVETPQTRLFKLDTAAPASAVGLEGTAGAAGWYRSPVTVTLTVSDATSGPAAIHWREAGPSWQTYTVPFVVAGEGAHLLEVQAADVAGNLEAAQAVTVPIDTAAPQSTLTFTGTLGENGWYRSAVDVTVAATDTTSGVGDIAWRRAGQAWQPYTGTFAYADEGLTSLEARATDLAGNVEEPPAAADLQIDRTPPVVTVTLAALTYTRGQTVTLAFTATDPLPGSGLQAITATLDGQAVVDGQVVDLQWLELGTHTLVVTATDTAGWETVVPAAFELTATLESLIETVERFCDLGEVDNHGICNSLLQKLRHALDKADGGQPGVAVNVLNAFINEVEAQTGKHISRRAALLLISDAQQLTEQMGGGVMLSLLFGGQAHLGDGVTARLGAPPQAVVVQTRPAAAPPARMYALGQAMLIQAPGMVSTLAAPLAAATASVAAEFTTDPAQVGRAQLYRWADGAWTLQAAEWQGSTLVAAGLDVTAGAEYALFAPYHLVFLPATLARWHH